MGKWPSGPACMYFLEEYILISTYLVHMALHCFSLYYIYGLRARKLNYYLLLNVPGRTRYRYVIK